MARIWRTRWGWLLTLTMAVAFTACGGGAAPEPEPEPEPQPQTQADTGESDRAAEEARRRAEEERRRREAERERVLSILRERVHFDFDRSDIRRDAEDVLQRKVTVLRQYSGIRLTVEGHADERGSNEYNLALGQRRAESVRSYLASYGLDPNRFETISYGEERPLANESNERAWAMNRRAEFVIRDEGQLGGSD